MKSTDWLIVILICVFIWLGAKSKSAPALDNEERLKVARDERGRIVDVLTHRHVEENDGSR